MAPSSSHVFTPAAHWTQSTGRRETGLCIHLSFQMSPADQQKSTTAGGRSSTAKTRCGTWLKWWGRLFSVLSTSTKSIQKSYLLLWSYLIIKSMLAIKMESHTSADFNLINGSYLLPTVDWIIYFIHLIPLETLHALWVWCQMFSVTEYQSSTAQAL